MKDFTLTHHATLIRGNRADVVEALEVLLGTPFTRAPHSDITYVTCEQLGIDEVRALGRAAELKPLIHETLTLIVAADSIGHEAQNALLKLTEDPPPFARFVFVLPPSAPILPTLRSRVVEHHTHSTKVDTESTFAHLSLRDSLQEIARASKDKDNEAMENILISLEARGTERIGKAGTLRALLTARRYIEARGAAPKMLLEHALLEEREAKVRS